MEKRIFWTAILLSVIWVGIPPKEGLRAQCTGGTNTGTITPTLSWQTIPCIKGGEYYRFFATLGSYYTFTYCFAGGFTPYDTEITIVDDGTGIPDPFGYANGGDCGLGDHLWYWSPPATGWYRVLVTKALCQTDNRCTVLAYHRELDPLGTPGRTCATPWVVGSLPYTQTGLSTCFYDNNYNNNTSCPTGYMTGEDFVITFSGTAGQCVTIFGENTFIYTGMFLFNGCPNVVGTTCVQYREAASANPRMTNITLPTTGTYYLVMDTEGGSVPCTGFDITIMPCIAIGQGSNCASAFTVPSLPYNQKGFTTCGKGNAYTSIHACASPYMNGEDFLFRYVSPGNECLDIQLSMTSGNTGFFVYNGCPNVGGTTCIASRTSAGGNPRLRDINLVAPGTYYIMVSTQPSPTCTPFDIKISNCPPPCGLNPNLNNSCSTAQPVNFAPANTVCGHTSLAFTVDQSPDLIADFCGSIENNGWFSFVADSTRMTMRIEVTNCLSGFGIQGRIFSTSDCINFTPRSNCWNPMQQSDGIIQATGLTVGNTYLLMLDGYSGDDCDFLMTRVTGGLPVVWNTFKARLNAEQAVDLNWSTFSEVNNEGFNIQRGYQTTKLGGDNFIWETLAHVDPKGDPSRGAEYHYVDHPEYSGKPWFYRIQQIDFDGTSDFTDYQQILIGGPEEALLQKLYPNPATSSCNLEYYSPEAGASTFVLYNLAGMLLKKENFSNNSQGVFYENVDISDLPNGLYFYVLSVNGKFFKGKLEVLH